VEELVKEAMLGGRMVSTGSAQRIEPALTALAL
jgi:hypothetical protein